MVQADRTARFPQSRKAICFAARLLTFDERSRNAGAKERLIRVLRLWGPEERTAKRPATVFATAPHRRDFSGAARRAVFSLFAAGRKRVSCTRHEALSPCKR